MRAWVLWDDPFAHGYDGYYYVLQVRSWQAGAPLFADDSLVFPLLAALGWLVGDVVVGNKLAACAFGALTAVGGAVAARRWTGSWWAATVTGALWAVSPLHLGISAEFLKNAAGLAVLALLLAVLPRCWRSRWALAGVGLLTLLALMTHKLAGVFAVLLTGVVLGLALWRRLRLGWSVVAGLGVVGLAGSLGVLRVVDLSRFSAGLGRVGDRWAPLVDPGLAWGEKLALAALYLAPVGLGLWAWRGPREQRVLAVALAVVALACTAPGLPMGYDLTAWRLALMGFVPLGLLAGALSARWPVVGGVLLALGLAQLPATVAGRREREPDYVRWSTVVPVIEERVAPDERLVAHRGLCGFLWAETGRVCENFAPQGDLHGWWRVSYGFGPRQLDPYGRSEPLLPGYRLMREADYRRMAEQEEHRMLRSPRNPHEARPDFVYGPGDTE